MADADVKTTEQPREFTTIPLSDEQIGKIDAAMMDLMAKTGGYHISSLANLGLKLSWTMHPETSRGTPVPCIRRIEDNEIVSNVDPKFPRLDVCLPVGFINSSTMRPSVGPKTNENRSNPYDASVDFFCFGKRDDGKIFPLFEEALDILNDWWTTEFIAWAVETAATNKVGSEEKRTAVVKARANLAKVAASCKKHGKTEEETERIYEKMHAKVVKAEEEYANKLQEALDDYEFKAVTHPIIKPAASGGDDAAGDEDEAMLATTGNAKEEEGDEEENGKQSDVGRKVKFGVKLFQKTPRKKDNKKKAKTDESAKRTFSEKDIASFKCGYNLPVWRDLLERSNFEKTLRVPDIVVLPEKFQLTTDRENWKNDVIGCVVASFMHGYIRPGAGLTFTKSAGRIYVISNGDKEYKQDSGGIRDDAQLDMTGIF